MGAERSVDACTKKEGERGLGRIRVSQISPLSVPIPGHGESVPTRFERSVDFKPSSGTPTTRTTQSSPHRDVSIRWNTPWRP